MRYFVCLNQPAKLFFSLQGRILNQVPDERADPKGHIDVLDDVALPKMWQVYLLNDDFTPMDFVIDVLKTFFNKTHDEATKIMLEVHHHGRSLCGIFTKDIAETKINAVQKYSKDHDYPLQCEAEPE